MCPPTLHCRHGVRYISARSRQVCTPYCMWGNGRFGDLCLLRSSPVEQATGRLVPYQHRHGSPRVCTYTPPHNFPRSPIQ